MSHNPTTPARTSVLLAQLFKSVDLDSFLQANEKVLCEPDFAAYITNLAKERGISREKIIKRAGIERTYGHQLFRGVRKPSRDKVLQLALGFELSVEDAQKLLKTADMSELYPLIPRDAAILYCLHHQYSIIETQLCLEGHHFTLLGGDEGHVD